MPPTPCIPFHIPYQSGKESTSLHEQLVQGDFAYPTAAHRKCSEALKNVQGGQHLILTGSCTSALEISALLLELQIGDEIVLPSFAYPTMANAFALRGARLVFVDIDPVTMNVDPEQLASAISPRTRAIVVMHYGGVACDMDSITSIAQSAGLPVIEDAAHCIGAGYRNRMLGTFGQCGTLSFHYTKNIHCSQGGALLLNRSELYDKAVRIAEKGTDRSKMLKGLQNYYSWVELGSSYTMNSLSAAFLSAQLEAVASVNGQRLDRWRHYRHCLQELGFRERLGLFDLPDHIQSNGHLFFIKCKNEAERSQLIHFLQERGVQAYFHYLPLHRSEAGQRYGTFFGEDVHTTRESRRLLRLPLYPALSLPDIEQVSGTIAEFYHKH